MRASSFRELTAGLPLLAAFLLASTTRHTLADPPAPGARIARDGYGVAHVTSDSLPGLFYGFGYATAEDRLFQIEMMRRTYWGRLSEVLGENLLEFDKANRRDNPSRDELRVQIAASLEPEVQTAVRSFAAGINGRIREISQTKDALLPDEFRRLAFEPAPWDSEDVAATFLSVLGLFTDLSAELANASMLDFLVRKHGQEAGSALFDDWCWGEDPDSPTTLPGEGSRERAGRTTASRAHPLMARILAAAPDAYLTSSRERTPRVASTGFDFGSPFGRPSSYALLLAPSKSTQGLAVLVGGPQFEFQVPSAVYEIALHGPGIEAVGSTVAGFPFVAFGYNDRAAFTSTAGGGNLMDVFAEELDPADPDQYRFRGAWKRFEVRTESFRVRGKPDPVTAEFRYSVHGPVFRVDAERGVAFAKQMSGRDTFLDGLKSSYRVMKARTATEFERAAVVSPLSINQFHANDQGDIAYFHQGLHPKRSSKIDPRLPTPGTGEFEWRGSIPRLRNPHGRNPKSGFLANWNNQPAPNWPHGDLATTDAWGGWGANARQTLLVDLVQAKQRLSVEDVESIIRTIAFVDKRTLRIRDRMIAAVLENESVPASLREPARLVASWDASLEDRDRDGWVDHPGAALFDLWWTRTVHALFASAFDGYHNPQGEAALDIIGRRYLGYTLVQKALEGRTRYDYGQGKLSAIVSSALADAVEELGRKYPGKPPTECRLPTPTDRFHPRTLAGHFFGQPIVSSFVELPPFPLVDRGTENHIVTLDPRGLRGWNVAAPGVSGFVDHDGKLSTHGADQIPHFLEFRYKRMGRRPTSADPDVPRPKQVTWTE